MINFNIAKFTELLHKYTWDNGMIPVKNVLLAVSQAVEVKK